MLVLNFISLKILRRFHIHCKLLADTYSFQRHVAEAKHMAETPGLKIVIVGAGIAGLTLANILEKHDLNYILLEKHSSVVCEVGASIGLFPHGLRVLDQLGIYEAISEFLEGQVSIGQTYIRRADGSILSKLGDITEHMVRR